MATGPDLRIGDSDREAAASVLREHYAQGRLTLDEFNQRLDDTFAAATQKQLSMITQDLPHVTVPGTTAPPRQRQPRPHGHSHVLPVVGLLIALLVVGGVFLGSATHGSFWPGKLIALLVIVTIVRGMLHRGGRRYGGPRGRSGYDRRYEQLDGRRGHDHHHHHHHHRHFGGPQFSGPQLGGPNGPHFGGPHFGGPRMSRTWNDTDRPGR